MSVITSILTANLEVFTIKTEVFTNPARFHCFPSRFDHRGRAGGGLFPFIDYCLSSCVTTKQQQCARALYCLLF